MRRAGRNSIARSFAILAPALALVSCGEKKGEAECRALAARKDYAGVAATCEAAYLAGGPPELGAFAARAAFELEDDASLARWAERLAGSAVEHRVLVFSAMAAERAGRVDQALALFAATLAKGQARADHPATADTAYRAFTLALRESRHRQALESALAMGDAAAVAGDRQLESRAAQALFAVLFSIGDLAGAAQAQARADQLLDETESDRAYWLLNEAAIRLEEGRPALATVALARARSLAATIGDPILSRSIELNLAEAALANGELGEADARIRAAEALAATPQERVSSHYFRARLAQAGQDFPAAAAETLQALAAEPPADWRWKLEAIAGEAFAAGGDDRSAQAAFGRAIAVVESLGSELGAAGLRTSLLDQKRQPYEGLFVLLHRQGRQLEALAVAEKAVARSAAEAFVLTAMPGPLSAGTWQPRIALARTTVLSELDQALGGVAKTADRSGLTAFAARLAALRHPVLFYFQAGDFYYLAVVGGGHVEIRPLAAKSRIERATLAWLAAPDDDSAATVLGDLLLPTWIESATPAGPLVVVPDGMLARVSFAALRRGRRRWIEEGFHLSYAPSLAAVEAERKDAAAAGVLVLGDPQGDLPAAREESREVAALLGVTPRVGRAATRSALGDTGRLEVLHLAAHAGLDAAGPWLGLADGDLRPAEVLGGGAAAELVVLASCDSAGAPGRGLAGSLPAAFLAAGSRSVLAALGTVEDGAARNFLRRFYAEGGRRQPAAALARTQRALAAASEPVATWAPFVILGSPHALTSPYPERKR